jgi:RND family efflux transporter MFP subunit
MTGDDRRAAQREGARGAGESSSRDDRGPRRARRGWRGLLALPLLLLACGEEEVAAPEVVRGVLVARVDAPGETQDRVLTGVTRSADTTDLSFRVAGQLVELGVKTGDLVETGALIGRLDRTDYEIELAEAKAALTQAEAELRSADASYARARALYEREGIARTDLEAARASAESGRANVDAAAQRVRAAERQLGFTRLVAPSEGAISAVPVELGENVTSGQGIAVLQTGGPPEVEVAFPEVLIASVEAGAPVEAIIEAFPNDVYKGKVRKVGIAPADGAATYPVTVRLDTGWDRIRPGMAAEVRFRFRQSESTQPIVPASAIGEDLEGRFVYVVEPGEGDFFRIRRQPVTVGSLGGEGVHVEAGLAGGEQIVVAGVPRIRDGLTVRILEADAWP